MSFGGWRWQREIKPIKSPWTLYKTSHKKIYKTKKKILRGLIDVCVCVCMDIGNPRGDFFSLLFLLLFIIFYFYGCDDSWRRVGTFNLPPSFFFFFTTSLWTSTIFTITRSCCNPSLIETTPSSASSLSTSLSLFFFSSRRLMLGKNSSPFSRQNF